MQATPLFVEDVKVVDGDGHLQAIILMISACPLAESQAQQEHWLHCSARSPWCGHVGWTSSAAKSCELEA